MGLILDSSLLIASEKRCFDLAGFLEEAAAMQSVHLAAITVSELWHGVERADSAERKKNRLQFVQKVLDNIPVIPFGVEEARTHARIWADLARKGQMIGAYDLLIAATAVNANHQLATSNRGEFQRVSGLQLAHVEKFLITD